MNKMRICLSFILLFFLIYTGTSQTPRFDHFDISTGLSQNNINGLVIDDKGNIWAGTLDGLNKYNGYEFEVFKPQAQGKGGISGNHLIEMGNGINGDFWITTRDGVLNQYQSSLQKFRQFENEIFTNKGIAPENNIVQYNDSLVWFSQNSRAGVLNINNKLCHTYDAPGYIHGITIKNDSLLVYGDFGVYYWKTGHQDHSLIVTQKKISSIPCYFLQKHGNKWINVTNKGIYNFKNDFNSLTPVFSFKESDLPDINPANLTSFAANKNDYWLGGNNLLVRIQKNKESWDPKRFSYDVENDYTFKGYNVTHLQFDELGNLWIGTQKNGINHFNYKKNQFLHYNWNAPSLSRPDADPVRAICHRRNGNLWLGFDRNGVGIIYPDGKQKFFSHYFTQSGDVNTINNVRSIFEDSDGNLWIAESGELCIFNEKLQRIEAVNVRLNWQWPHHSYVLKEFEPGTLIITSSQQIGLVDIKTMALKETISLVNNKNYLPGSLRDIILDPNGNYWVAKDEHGIFKASDWDESFYVVQKQSHQLSDNKVYCMLANGDSLWISTNSGLNLFNLKEEKVIKRYFERDGLCNNIVYSISRDNSGILWMSTNRGISRFNPDTERFKTYLSNDFFMDDAHFTDNLGNIYFGGYSGVVAFHPEDIDLLHVTARTTLENFSLFNQQILPEDSINNRVILKKPINQTSAITLKHDENSFTFQFNAHPFDVPNQNVFRYRLSGLQEEWSTSDGTNRQASYTAVPPGSYTFEVQSAFSQTQYGTVNKIIIEIIPPYWQTTWFKGILILVIIIAVFTGYHFRLRQIRTRNIFLKNQIEEQTRELRNRNKQIVEISEKLHEADQSKLQFFTNISHDFRTPLTLILAHLDNLDNTKNKAKKTIRNNALRLLSLVNQLIDLRKLEQGELALSVSQLDIVYLTSEIVESFQVLASRQEIDLQFYSQVKTLEVWLDKDKIEKTLNNLLSNALKYTPHGKSVLVSIAENEDSFSLTVEDRGIGMSKEEQEKIFDRFYRTDKGQQNATGHGIGLPIVKGLTEIQKGTISIKSEVGKGSRFTLNFLKGKKHYSDKDFKPSEDEVILSGKDLLAASTASSFSRLGMKNVLLVEDNDELSEFLKRILDQWFNVRLASNGREALDVMVDFIPELIISDVMMPVMDGIEFCRRVKADIRSSQIPFIILTARTDAETHIEGLELGADDYIEKPFESRVFLSRIQALLENREKIKLHFENKTIIPTAEKEFSPKDREFLEAVNNVIEKRFPEVGFTVEKLSHEMNMSRSTFYRKFKALTGISAAEYLRKIRLQKAAKYIKQEETPASQVAEMVGFQSVAHFRKCFKEEFGTTPGNWHYF